MAPPFWWEYINTDILADSRKKVNLFLVTLQTLYEYGSSPPRLARSALGSTSGGAAERSEAEGVRFVGWYKPLISAVPVGVDEYVAPSAALPPQL